MCVCVCVLYPLFLIQYYNIYKYDPAACRRPRMREKNVSAFFLYNIIFRFDYNTHGNRPSVVRRAALNNRQGKIIIIKKCLRAYTIFDHLK